MGGALVARLWGRRDRDVRGRPDGGVASLLWVRASIAKALEELARPATRGRTRRASTRCPCSGTRDAPTSVSRRPRQPRARAGSPGRVRERPRSRGAGGPRSEEHTSELQSPCNLVCRLLLEKKNKHHR